jgi:8-oxo-dGTP pyrophosphatase MutT (NUDIX family)
VSSLTPSGEEEARRELKLDHHSGPGQELKLGGTQEPGQGLSLGEATPPRQAATVILLRGGAQTLEMLLVKRTERAKFMGGVWVFPGGAVDEDDLSPGTEDGGAHRAAATRELREEAGIAIADPATLVEFSRWITPEEVTVRFDTRFFLAELPDGQEPVVDGEECIDQGWFSAQGALDAYASGQIALVFPTIKHLEQLRPFSSVEELLDYARGREVRPVQPKVWFDGEVARVALPGEPGYE